LQVAEGLALSQKDKLASLAENVEFESEENIVRNWNSEGIIFPINTGTQRDDSKPFRKV
jgi:hypothetical protein